MIPSLLVHAHTPPAPWQRLRRVEWRFDEWSIYHSAMRSATELVRIGETDAVEALDCRREALGAAVLLTQCACLPFKMAHVADHRARSLNLWRVALAVRKELFAAPNASGEDDGDEVLASFEQRRVLLRGTFRREVARIGHLIRCMLLRARHIAGVRRAHMVAFAIEVLVDGVLRPQLRPAWGYTLLAPLVYAMRSIQFALLPH